MNQIILYVEKYTNSNKLSKDGITFSDVMIIKLLIDGEDIEENEYFKDGLIYFDELAESMRTTGNYLIFTCACGIAEDGGWEGVKVDIADTEVKWTMEVGDSRLSYTFSRVEYTNEINSVKKILEEKGSLTIEPASVVFPDGFKR